MFELAICSAAVVFILVRSKPKCYSSKSSPRFRPQILKNDIALFIDAKSRRISQIHKINLHKWPTTTNVTNMSILVNKCHHQYQYHFVSFELFSNPGENQTNKQKLNEHKNHFRKSFQIMWLCFSPLSIYIYR